MKKIVFVLCFYSTKLLSQEAIERSYSIQQEPEIYFFKYEAKSAIKESIYLIKSDFNVEENSNAKTGKVDPPMVLNPFPDPFSSSINVNIPGNLYCNFSLSDISGDVVFQTQIFGEKGRLNLSFLPEGVYFAAVSKK